MTGNQISPEKEIINRCTKIGALIAGVLMFATGAFNSRSTVPFIDRVSGVMLMGFIAGAIGGVLGASVGMIINALSPSHSTADTQPVSLGGAFMRVLAFVALLIAISVCAGVALLWWTHIHLTIPPGLNSAEQIKQLKLANDEALRYSSTPFILPVALFLAALIAFGRRPQTIVIAGAFSVLFFFAGRSMQRLGLVNPRHPFPLAGPPIAFGQPSGIPMTAQQRAVQLFPDLAIANSKLNQEFVRRYRLYKAQRPAYFDNPEWPTQLARESQITPANQSAAAAAEPPLALPKDGEIQIYTSAPPLAPFEIRSSVGTHYLVKLVEAASGTTVMSIFVWGGSAVNVKVPLGDYIVKYAAGAQWYGYRYLFGPETSYSQADTRVSFRQDGMKLTGHTLTLYKVLNGNLRTKPINASEF